jgi:nucleotide-binding universal stress UspA family protein
LLIRDLEKGGFRVAKRILVPLDRTIASEAVVPLIAEVARGAGSTVRLLHIQPVPENVLREDGRVVAYADQEMARLEAEGSNYLEEVEARLLDVPTERVVRFGDPASEILVEAEAWPADLIALTTRAGGWIWRLGRGRIANKIFRKTRTPVMLYRCP